MLSIIQSHLKAMQVSGGLRVNVSTAAGPDNIPGNVLETCANRLVDGITDI